MGIQEQTDLDIITAYQVAFDDQFYNEMVRRYRPSIMKQSHRIYRGLPKEALGLEFDDVYVEVLVQLQRAMKYVKREKITDESVFRFNVIFQNYCKVYYQNRMKHYNSKKERNSRVSYNTDSIEQVHIEGQVDMLKGSIGKKMMEITPSVEDQYFRTDIMNRLLEVLSEKEQKVVHMLMAGKNFRQIRKELGIGSSHFKKKFRRKISKIFYEVQLAGA